jgi:hypothetical protein
MSKYTRLHYEQTVRFIVCVDCARTREHLIEKSVERFAADNPAFRADVFRIACQPGTAYRNRSRDSSRARVRVKEQEVVAAETANALASIGFNMKGV